jgi:hypothetical protein
MAVETGFVRKGFHLDGIKGNPIPDVFGKYGHPPVIDCFSGINRLIQNDGRKRNLCQRQGHDRLYQPFIFIGPFEQVVSLI